MCMKELRSALHPLRKPGQLGRTPAGLWQKMRYAAGLQQPLFFPLPPLFRGAWFTIGPLGFPHQLSPCWNIPKALWSDWRRPTAWIVLVGPAGPATSFTSSFPVAAFRGAILQASGFFAQHFPEKQC